MPTVLTIRGEKSCISYILDALDRVAARRLGQATRFGAVLYKIARCMTTCLLVFLASSSPSLDKSGLSSYHIHMYVTLAMSGQMQSLKNIDQSRPWVMRTYYSSQPRKFCLLYAQCFIALYRLQKDEKASQIWGSPWSARAMRMARADKIDISMPWLWLARCDFEMRMDARLLRAKIE
ncbi:CDP-diacylglycerol--inositol 3-phosphatidyltransferase [Aspergillus fumigatus]